MEDSNISNPSPPDHQVSLPPLADPVFAKIFENKEKAGTAMMYLINAVKADAGLPLISEISYMRAQTVQMGDGIGLRGCRLDVMAKDITGHITSIEVQIRNVRVMNDRSLFNYGHIVQNEVEAGVNHDRLPFVSMINILGENIRENREDYHQQAEVRYINEPYESAAVKLRIHNIELPRFRLQHEIQGGDMLKGSKLAMWLYLFDKGYLDPEFLKEAAKMDVGYQQFVERYSLVGSDKDLRHTYHNWKVGQMDFNQKMDESRQEGLQEGLQKGLQKGRYDVISSMYLNGLPQHVIDMAAKAANISKDEVERIRKSVQTQKRPPTIPK